MLYLKRRKFFKNNTQILKARVIKIKKKIKCMLYFKRRKFLKNNTQIFLRISMWVGPDQGKKK